MSPADPAPPPFIRVAAGVLRDTAGRVLVARRPDRAHGGGFWEFPGGKIATGESPLEGLHRELAEELGIQVLAASPLMTYEHRYPDRTVELHVWTVGRYSGEPVGREGQPLQWLPVSSLAGCGLLPADLPIIAAL